MRFTFKRATSTGKRDLISHLGLKQLAERAAAVDNRGSLGLGDDDCLRHLDDPEALTLLEISERAAGGMYGSWQGDRSKLYRAMCTLGISHGGSGRGGSFGYGKAGLIRASKVRSVIAYTCFAEFAETDDDPGVTRRLLGMTYWGRHDVPGHKDTYAGAARYGDASSAESDSAVPFENAEADSIASRLGLKTRNAHILDQRGSTFLIIEPTVSEDDLIAAAERYWWPALQEQSLQFEIAVVGSDGIERRPRPRSNPDLKSFIDAYEVATTPQDNPRPTIHRPPFRKIKGKNSGRLGLIADPDSWSFPDYSPELEQADSHVDHASLVALMRNPMMVVEYYQASSTAPHVRGVFVAHDDINETLRASEPKAHDAWQDRASSGDISSDDAELVRLLLNRIKEHVNKFRKDLKPKPKPTHALKLTEWDRIMRNLMSGKGTGTQPPPQDERLLSIHPGGRLKAHDDGQLYIEGTARVGFSDHYKGEGENIEVKIRYRYLEEDRLGGKSAIIVESMPEGFKELTGARSSTEIHIKGYLKMGETASISYFSENYNADWSGKLFVDADIMPDAPAPSRPKSA